MGRERTGGDFGTEKAKRSATFWDVSIRAGTAEIEFGDRCLKPLGRLVGCLTAILSSDGVCAADRCPRLRTSQPPRHRRWGWSYRHNPARFEGAGRAFARRDFGFRCFLGAS